MERVSFVKNGELRLPPGFRFHPTDEELVVQYLKRKVLSTPLPFSSFIPDLLHLFKSDPWDLPGDMEQERYFFSRKEAKYPNGNRSNRATMSGYWKATGLDKHIISTGTSKGVLLVGMKKTLVFYRGKPPHGSRTDWIMHEYRLHSHSHSQMQSPVVPMEDWVLCRIFFKRRGSSKNAEALSSSRSNKVRNSCSKVVFYDFLSQNRGAEDPVPGASSSSSAATSGITEEVSASDRDRDHHHGVDDDDSSSCCNSKYFPNCFRRKLVP